MDAEPEQDRDLTEPAPVPNPLRDIAQLKDVSAILQVCTRVTGMRYTVIAHVTEDRWLACAVLDEVDFGLPVGGELPIKTTLCNEVRQNRATIAFDHASASDQWRDHPTPRSYGLESYIAAPILLSDGTFFGTLCSIDPKPAPASRPETVAMFELFARLIAMQLDARRSQMASEAALLDARETAALRDQFIAVLGHDLRNPLAAVEAGVGLLERRVQAPGAQPILAEMRRSTGRMSRLINDVLDFARGRLGGGLPISIRPAPELQTVLQGVVEELRAAHPERTVQSDIAIDRTVLADPDRLAQLLSNLLGNALAHGDPAAPVRVRVAVVGETLDLSVANSGAPIPEALRPRLFQPFNRRDTADVREGLGLGLYISDRIATAHAGSLTLTSDADETCFRFSLPVRAGKP